MKTPTWQLSSLPSRPLCCRATPALWSPFLAKPLSSTTPTTPIGLRAAVGTNSSTKRDWISAWARTSSSVMEGVSIRWHGPMTSRRVSQVRAPRLATDCGQAKNIFRCRTSQTGSFYYHCDWHASHYVKVMLDQIFGENFFQNEIVWKRSSAHSDSKRYGANHDTILFYSNGKTWTWNKLY